MMLGVSVTGSIDRDLPLAFAFDGLVFSISSSTFVFDCSALKVAQEKRKLLLEVAGATIRPFWRPPYPAIARDGFDADTPGGVRFVLGKRRVYVLLSRT